MRKVTKVRPGPTATKELSATPRLDAKRIRIVDEPTRQMVRTVAVNRGDTALWRTARDLIRERCAQLGITPETVAPTN